MMIALLVQMSFSIPRKCSSWSILGGCRGISFGTICPTEAIVGIDINNSNDKSSSIIVDRLLCAIGGDNSRKYLPIDLRHGRPPLTLRKADQIFNITHALGFGNDSASLTS